MMVPRRLCLALLTLATIGSAYAAAVDDLAWIAGDWTGTAGEATIDEVWVAPAGGTMMGMFRLVRDGEVRFYEFMTIEPSDDGPVLRIKHYDPGLVGWEEKAESVTFRCADASPGLAVFETTLNGNLERLVFERSEDRLTIRLEKPAKDSTTVFRFRVR